MLETSLTDTINKKLFIYIDFVVRSDVENDKLLDFLHIFDATAIIVTKYEKNETNKTINYLTSSEMNNNNHQN